jgi:mRNA m6A methyltransferase non-catalytic subunit
MFTRLTYLQDTDVMLWEGDPDDPTLKPPEMYTLVENFCLGLRRLELFARGRTLRRGWVSVLAAGEEMRVPDVNATKGSETENTPRPWNKEKWDANIRELARGGKFVVPMTSGSHSNIFQSYIVHD